MKLEGVRYVFAAYGVAFAVLLAWVWMIGVKVRRLDAASENREELSSE